MPKKKPKEPRVPWCKKCGKGPVEYGMAHTGQCYQCNGGIVSTPDETTIYGHTVSD